MGAPLFKIVHALVLFLRKPFSTILNRLHPCLPFAGVNNDQGAVAPPTSVVPGLYFFVLSYSAICHK